MDTLESLSRKIDGAVELKSIVRTMKAMAASNIGQYEMAVDSLKDYAQNVELAILAYFKSKKNNTDKNKETSKKNKSIVAIVFGSDQGLVGQFNDSLCNFVLQSFKDDDTKKEVWSVGERIQLLLSDEGFKSSKTFLVPNSVMAVTDLVGKILIDCEAIHEKDAMKEFYIIHNQPLSQISYQPIIQRLLPLDEKWKETIEQQKWPTKYLPQVITNNAQTIAAFISEYLFVSLFKACTESLASENASRLNAMQRAEKNINESLDNLNSAYHSLRQNSIDEELFDVVAGFETLRKKAKNKKL